MLFMKKKKKPAPKPSRAKNGPELIISVPYSEHFNGFKRAKLDSYNDKEAERGIKAVQAAETIDRITFELYRPGGGVNPLLRVYADGHKIGTLWSSSRREQFDAILAGKVEKAHVGFNATDSFVFLKY